jgi:hypothetical protein
MEPLRKLKFPQNEASVSKRWNVFRAKTHLNKMEIVFKSRRDEMIIVNVFLSVLKP